VTDDGVAIDDAGGTTELPVPRSLVWGAAQAGGSTTATKVSRAISTVDVDGRSIPGRAADKTSAQ